MEKLRILKLLSDDTRYHIFMKLLEYDELCVSELEELLAIKQANTSKHLKLLKESYVVSFKREKNMIKYRIDEDFLNDNTDLIRYLLT
ncbi:MAG: winged helix-turn-helix transcriptional regulator [Bacilli bacterium]|nr:winged helix-turn-helix transcriptional regulator [Bacilli bacterium]